MKNRRRITAIVAALILAIVGTVALMGYVRSAKDQAVSDEALVDVYVVDTLVPKGAEPETINRVYRILAQVAAFRITQPFSREEYGDSLLASAQVRTRG